MSGTSGHAIRDRGSGQKQEVSVKFGTVKKKKKENTTIQPQSIVIIECPTLQSTHQTVVEFLIFWFMDEYVDRHY